VFQELTKYCILIESLHCRASIFRFLLTSGSSGFFRLRFVEDWEEERLVEAGEEGEAEGC